jgi:bacillithiol system protein YtxJ
MNWKSLSRIEEVEDIAAQSAHKYCLIFKHSTRCSISALAKMRIESAWSFPLDKVEPYLLDLIAYRPVSNYIAEHFSVHHESPQILLIRQGECVLDASHLDIQVAEIEEVVAAAESALHGG